jgi:PPK2 family polyphosphate:nucleotide phosphotransferase
MSNRIFKAVDHSWLVRGDGAFRIAKAPTRSPDGPHDKGDCERRLAEWTLRLDRLQHLFYAQDERSLLVIFQAMDAAGKDSTIRAVMSGVNPAGCQVHSFKQPSVEEYSHDFLWRATQRLPERGRIGVFNRSHYEDVLIARVHPELLARQRTPMPNRLDKLWKERFESIRDFERHLARNGVVILKFFLHVSKAEQKRRFLARLEDPQKYWKFEEGDVHERAHWRSYQHAYEAAINATASDHAPWYAIPADDKPYLRMNVAEIIVRTLESLKLKYPTIDAKQRRRFDEMRGYLEKG